MYLCIFKHFKSSISTSLVTLICFSPSVMDNLTSNDLKVSSSGTKAQNEKDVEGVKVQFGIKVPFLVS